MIGAGELRPQSSFAEKKTAFALQLCCCATGQMLTTKLFEEDRVVKTMFEIRQYRVALMSKSVVHRLKGWVGRLILFLRPEFLSPPTQPFCC